MRAKHEIKAVGTFEQDLALPHSELPLPPFPRDPWPQSSRARVLRCLGTVVALPLLPCSAAAPASPFISIEELCEPSS